MQIRHDVRAELEEDVHLPARLGLALDEEVAVEVEQVVVSAAARPRRVVFGGDPGFVRPAPPRDLVLVHEPVPPIRVLHRIDEDERLREDEIDVGIPHRREQVVGFGHRGAARTDLVAVDPVHQRGDDRQLGHKRLGLRVGKAARIGEPLDPGLDLLQPRHPFGRADDKDDERPPLPALPVLDETRPLRRRGRERLHVPDHVVRRRDDLAEAVSRHLFERRDAGVVARSGREFLRRGGKLDRGGERERG